MFYVYILHSLTDNSFYIGYTSDVYRRFDEHNLGKSIATKQKRPFQLIYAECFIEKADAKRREKYFKSGWGRKSIKILLKTYLERCPSG